MPVFSFSNRDDECYRQNDHERVEHIHPFFCGEGRMQYRENFRITLDETLPKGQAALAFIDGKFARILSVPYISELDALLGNLGDCVYEVRLSKPLYAKWHRHVTENDIQMPMVH